MPSETNSPKGLGNRHLVHISPQIISCGPVRYLVRGLPIGLFVRFTFHERKKQYEHDPPRHFGLASARRAAHVAVQRELGILPQRGHWIDSGDRCDPGGTRTYLTACGPAGGPPNRSATRPPRVWARSPTVARWRGLRQTCSRGLGNWLLMR